MVGKKTRRSKTQKPEPQIRAELSDNVVSLRDIVFKHLPSPTSRNNQLATKADISPEQVRRVIDMKLGASIDIVAKLARALKVKPYELLTPYFVTQSNPRSTDAEAPPFHTRTSRPPPLR